jgi:hypothetical protein
LSTRKKPLSDAEIREAFPAGSKPILTLGECAALSGRKLSTLYEWKSKGWLDGAFRKRGKETLVWRDRFIKILFNGPDWINDET